MYQNGVLVRAPDENTVCLTVNMNKRRLHYPLLLLLPGLVALQGYAQKKNAPRPVPPISVEKGKIQYQPDSLGNRIPDFSYAGYRAGEEPIPTGIVCVVVPVQAGDATPRIQAALDYAAKQPRDESGLPAVVLLQPGTYTVNGSLLIRSSNVILRGSGTAGNGTIILGGGKDRSTLIRINGVNNQVPGTAVPVSDAYVPVNARTFSVASTNGLSVGSEIIVTRPCTQEWINTLGTVTFGGGLSALGWKPGQRVIQWKRVVTALNGNTISIDAPITTALDTAFGGGFITPYSWSGRITNCGIENLQLESEYDPGNEKDEDHRWMAITIDNAKDCFVRRVQFSHFAGSAVAVYDNASRVTVEDCISTQPVSEIGGERRNTFFTSGQQVLFQRCRAEEGFHDFSTGFCTPGPTAFVQCESSQPYSFSGGLDSWSSGVLFDAVLVDGNAISFFNRGQDGQGAGWNIANSVLWNCSAARIDCYAPPGAMNWAIGSWSQFAGDGYWGESNNNVEPRSLYYAQLRERIGKVADQRTQVMEIGTEASSSPTVEAAQELIRASVKPAQTLAEFIQETTARNPIPVNAKGIKTIDEVGVPVIPTNNTKLNLHVSNGWLVGNDHVMAGEVDGVPWWNGSARPYAAKAMQPAITRFVPGRIGRGLTDDLDELTDSMVATHTVAMEQNYGLWYERRRDDHERIRRMDGDVWTPFYELPFARTGTGTAWDGLSKYDLTRYNYFYWSRLKQFANLGEQKGLVLINQDYFQHNIIEAGAHYVDFPWRTANNINKVDFPEPVPFAGDKRVFMAEQFYDTTHPVRAELHRKFIRQCLDNFSDNTNVIHFIGEEFTGPLYFVQFWLNTIRQWKEQHPSKELIGLSVTKDVQDAILADPGYAALIDVIDIKYWHYQANGEPYAPKGGQNLAPRQHARLLKPKASSPQQVYRAVAEYRERFPAKAVMYSGDSGDKNGWAILMAGGSFSNVVVKDPAFWTALKSMKPDYHSQGPWKLEGKNGIVVYAPDTQQIATALPDEQSSFVIHWINTASGAVQTEKKTVRSSAIQTFKKPAGGSWALWLDRK